MYYYPRRSGSYPLKMYYYPWCKVSYPLNMYYYPRRSGSYPLNMYYYPRRKVSYPLNMYFYPRRSGNSPRGSGNSPWRMGSYPVSEYSNLCLLTIVQPGVSPEISDLLTRAPIREGMSPSPLSKTIEAARPTHVGRPTWKATIIADTWPADEPMTFVFWCRLRQRWQVSCNA